MVEGTRDAVRAVEIGDVEQPITSHGKHRDALYKHSGLMVKNGDRLQASEKVWGAVAHALKTVAAPRDWPYAAHADAGVIIGHIANLMRDDRIRLLFDSVNNLHVNFYADGYDMEEIKIRRKDGAELLALLKKANRELPRDAPPPPRNNRNRRYWERADARTERAAAFRARR